jgi:hypothetical protein
MSPVLLFTFYKRAEIEKTADLVGGRVIFGQGQNVTKIAQKSIPIYLSEFAFKTAWKSHDVSINIGSKSVGDELFQTPYNSNITINFSYSQDMGIMSKIIPLLDLCYTKLSQADYDVSYFNKDVFVLKGKLTDFKQNSQADPTLSEISLTISKEIKEADKTPNEDKDKPLTKIGWIKPV